MMDEARLWDLMNDARDRMTFPQKRLWQAIRIDPQSWSNTTYGPHTRFWVVALIGQKAIWYNDFEHGFDLTPYRTHGEIGAFSGNQFELELAVQHVADEIECGYSTVPRMSGPIPGEYEGRD
jgi:hypothetical protein